jgi:hypothetical protein
MSVDTNPHMHREGADPRDCRYFAATADTRGSSGGDSWREALWSVPALYPINASSAGTETRGDKSKSPRATRLSWLNTSSLLNIDTIAPIGRSKTSPRKPGPKHSRFRLKSPLSQSPRHRNQKRHSSPTTTLTSSLSYLSKSLPGPQPVNRCSK